MDRALVSVAERHALVISSASFRPCPRKPNLQLSRLTTQIPCRAFLQGRPLYHNDRADYVTRIRRKKSAGPVPAVWMMTGGPRTYPGGVTKWQWKRRQRKEDRELERNRLLRERKLFRTRRRQEIRGSTSKVTSRVDGWLESSLSGFVESYRTCSHLAPNTSSSRELLVDDSLGVLSTSAKAAEGRQILGTLDGGWTGNKEEVAEQIKKVRSLVSQRELITSYSEEETMSLFGLLPLSPLTLKALHFVLGIHNMSTVQEETLATILNGTDLLARAKRGRDYIVVSLLHAVEVILSSKHQQLPKSEIARMHGEMTVSGRFPVTVLFVCPTQERVTSVAAEARALLTFHSAISVQVVMGGNNIKKEVHDLQRSPCDILVATPGRLLAHLENTPELYGQLREVRLFVLDEVQKLLDMGYRRSLGRLAQAMSRHRQTLLWSASLSNEVHDLSQCLLKKDREIINTCESEEDELAYLRVRQEVCVAPMEGHLAILYATLKCHIEQEPDYKVVVFCQTARTTHFMAELFKHLGFCTRELHMRKLVKQRDRVASEFRISRGGLILFTCGASVWGAANPDVTLIVQVGSPLGREQYIQRVTLSGEETKTRKCVILLMPHEQAFLKKVTDLPLSQSAGIEMDPDVENQVQQAMKKVNGQVRVKAYVAWLRYHITIAKLTSLKKEAVKLANVYSSVLGFQVPPQLNPITLKALGLQSISKRRT